jgi:hypothetical protein
MEPAVAQYAEVIAVCLLQAVGGRRRAVETPAAHFLGDAPGRNARIMAVVRANRLQQARLPFRPTSNPAVAVHQERPRFRRR